MGHTVKYIDTVFNKSHLRRNIRFKMRLIIFLFMAGVLSVAAKYSKEGWDKNSNKIMGWKHRDFQRTHNINREVGRKSKDHSRQVGRKSKDHSRQVGRKQKDHSRQVARENHGMVGSEQSRKG